MFPHLDRREARIGLTLLLALVALLYSPSLRNGFTHDDHMYVRAERSPGNPNPMTSELLPLSEYFRSFYNRGLAEAGYEYRPVSVYSYALVHHVAGRHFERGSLGESLPQHAVNLLLHLAATLLVYRLLRALGAVRSAALAAAAVFGVHAIHSEAVVSIVGRCELFAFCFGSGGALLALRGARQRGLERGLSFALAGVAFFLAFASKESALAWPPALLVILLARRQARAREGALDAERVRAGLVTTTSVSVLPLLAFFALRASMIRGLTASAPAPDPMSNPLAHLPYAERFMTAVTTNAYGVFLTLFPFDLASDYGLAVFPVVESALAPSFLLSLLLLGAILVGGLASFGRRPLLFLAMAFFLGFSFLVSNIPVVIGTPFAERLYYTPSLALSLVVAALAESRWPDTRTRRMAFAATAVWLLLSSAVVVQRSLLWRDNRTLFSHDVVSQPRSARLHYFMADFAMFDGDSERRLHHMGKAFELKPEVARAWLRFAWFLREPEVALEATRRGLAAATGSSAKYRFHLFWTRAQILASLGRRAEEQVARRSAIELLESLLARPAERAALRDALANNPPAARAWLEASALLVEHHRLDLAEASLREGLAANDPAAAPHRFELHWALAEILVLQGRLPEARVEIEAAAAVDSALARERLGSLWRIGELRGDSSSPLGYLDQAARLELARDLLAAGAGPEPGPGHPTQ